MDKRKIAFFDIDGTLTSEIDGSVPESAAYAIGRARENGHLMFINTGRCMQNVEKRFKDVGFDGYVCGCGTNIYSMKDGLMTEVLHAPRPAEVTHEILEASRAFQLDILFEARDHVQYDATRPIITKGGKWQYDAFAKRNYIMNKDVDAPDFTCDKFVVWFKNLNDIDEFRKTSDKYFECIDRGGDFREFVPHGYSKATGIKFLLDMYGLNLEDSYAFGDSSNDLPMLEYVPHSVAMGNASPGSLFDIVSYSTTRASEDGIYNALKHFKFF